MMKHSVRRLAGAGLAVCLGLSATACAGGSASSGGGSNTDVASGVDPVVKAYQGPKVDLSGQSLTVTTSEADGLNLGASFLFNKLRQWGADVDIVVLTSTSGIETMEAGRSDFGSHGADEVVLGNAQGANVTAIGSVKTKQSYVLVAKKDIRSVAALKGHTIAMSGPSGFDTLLSKYALKKAGVGASDAKLVQIGGSPDRASALLAGSVDASTIFLSGWEELKSRKTDIHLLTNFADTTDFPGDALYAKNDYLTKNPKVALGMACANLEANDWLNNNEAAYLKFAKTQIAAGADRQGLKSLWKAATSEGMWPTDPTKVISTTGLGDLEKAMLDSGAIKKDTNVDGAVDTSYLKKAASMGCGQS